MFKLCDNVFCKYNENNIIKFDISSFKQCQILLVGCSLRVADKLFAVPYVSDIGKGGFLCFVIFFKLLRNFVTAVPLNTVERGCKVIAFVIEIVGQLIDELYGLSIFGYLGSFIGIVYYVIALRSIQTINTENK